MYCKDKLSRVTSFVGFLSCYWDVVHLIPSVPEVWPFNYNALCTVLYYSFDSNYKIFKKEQPQMM